MINGKLETWQVLRFFRHHPDGSYTAEAPDIDDFFPCSASTDGMHTEFITHFPDDDGGDSDGSPPTRSDWTILRDGKPVRFRKRAKAPAKCQVCEAIGGHARANAAAFMLEQTAFKLGELAKSFRNPRKIRRVQ